MMERGTRVKELFPSTHYHNPELKTSSFVPKIPQFSGDDPPQKGDVPYMEWRFEIQCLLSDPDMNSSAKMKIECQYAVFKR